MPRRVMAALVIGWFLLACLLPAGHGPGGMQEGGVEPAGWQLLVAGCVSVMLSRG